MAGDNAVVIAMATVWLFLTNPVTVATAVSEGEISPFGYSDLYLRQDNPFREGEKEGFKGGKKVAVIAPAAGPPGLMAIGRQSYGAA